MTKAMLPQCSATPGRGAKAKRTQTLRDAPDHTEEPPAKRRITRWLEDLQQSPEEEISEILAKRKSTASLRRQQSDQSLTSSSNLLGDEKNVAYRGAQYELQLEAAGVYLDDPIEDLPPGILRVAEELLSKNIRPPSHSLFSEELFDKVRRAVHGQNEARIRRDITPHLFPAPLTYPALLGHEILIESNDDGWNSCVPITRPRPQPDQAIGFSRRAFSAEQLEKLSPYTGGRLTVSRFMATWYMYFPFYTVEVKSSSALEIADHQNAHSAAVCVRALVELYRIVGRLQELDRHTLAWSMSHDQSMVRIYGYYVKIKDQTHTIHRYDIQKFDFTNQRGRDRWISYNFGVNVLEQWVPNQLKRICSAIDALPTPIGSVSQSTDVLTSADLTEVEISSIPDQITPVTSFTGISEEQTLTAEKKRKHTTK